jgi:hypothetical protein
MKITKMTALLLLCFIGCSKPMSCTINLSAMIVGYSDLWSFIECTTGHMELFEVSPFGHYRLSGAPNATLLEDVSIDLPYLFKGKITGHLVVEKYTESDLIIVTNRHLAVLFDPLWILLLLTCHIAFAFPLAKIVVEKLWGLYKKWLDYDELGREFEVVIWLWLYGVILCVLLISYAAYYGPLIQVAPTRFKYLDPRLSQCTVLEEPDPNVEFAFSLLYSSDHFLHINDWIRLSCPKSILVTNVNLEKYVKKFNNTIPNQLGVVHVANELWWQGRQDQYRYIFEKDPEKLQAHEDFFFGNMSAHCIDKPCWWGKDLNVLEARKSYILLNSTLLPGHSGLSCKKQPQDKEFHGIVQGYSPRLGYNICTKLENLKTDWTFLVLAILPALLTNLCIRRSWTTMGVVSVLAYALSYENVYF